LKTGLNKDAYGEEEERWRFGGRKTPENRRDSPKSRAAPLPAGRNGPAAGRAQ